MPVKFRCSECTQKLRIEDSFRGKLVACVRCGAKQRVPMQSSPEFAEPQPGGDEYKLATPGTPAAEPQLEKPTVKRTESKKPKPLKPWQPRPVREEPLPSEQAGDALERPPSKRPPVREEPLPSEKPQPQTRRENTPPGELSYDALSAIFDEPIAPAPSAVEFTDDAPRDVAPEIIFDSEREEDKLSAAPDVLRKQLKGRDVEVEAEEDAGIDAAAEYSSPEFDSAPLVAAGSRHFEAVEVPAAALVSPDVHEPAPAHASVAAHAEPSLVPPAKKLDVEELIDMTAMVDIVFFLLIFFLVTSMHSLDSTIPMPIPDPQKGAAKEPQSVAAIDSDDSYVVVRVDKNDKMTVEGAEVRNERDLLFKLLQLRRSAARPEKLLVIGHGDSTHGTAVMILDAGRELGMEHVKLTVQDEEE